METIDKEDKDNPSIVHCFAVSTHKHLCNILGITNFSNIVLIAQVYPRLKADWRVDLANNLIKEYGVKRLTEIQKVFV